MKVDAKISVLLMVISVICIGISMFYRVMAKSTHDAPASFYERMHRMRDIFLWIGIGLTASGAVLYAVGFVTENRR